MDKASTEFWSMFDWLVKHREPGFHGKMLSQVFKRAQGGDVAAIRFLEDKGCSSSPHSQRENQACRMTLRTGLFLATWTPYPTLNEVLSLGTPARIFERGGLGRLRGIQCKWV